MSKMQLMKWKRDQAKGKGGAPSEAPNEGKGTPPAAPDKGKGKAKDAAPPPAENKGKGKGKDAGPPPAEDKGKGKPRMLGRHPWRIRGREKPRMLGRHPRRVRGRGKGRTLSVSFSTKTQSHRVLTKGGHPRHKSMTSYQRRSTSPFSSKGVERSN
jgi:hypothetical protein